MPWRRVIVVAFYLGCNASPASKEAWGAQVTRHVYPNLDHRIDGRELSDAKTFLATVLR